jgi:hypothetical protein
MAAAVINKSRIYSNLYVLILLFRVILSSMYYDITIQAVILSSMYLTTLSSRVAGVIEPFTNLSTSS